MHSNCKNNNSCGVSYGVVVPLSRELNFHFVQKYNLRTASTLTSKVSAVDLFLVLMDGYRICCCCFAILLLSSASEWASL